MAARPLVPRRVWLGAVTAMAVAFGLVALRTGADAPAPPAAAAPAEAAAPPASAAPPALASVPPAPAAPASVAPPPTRSEEELMDRLRADVDADPRTAVALADDGERRFPSGRYADERAWLRMRGLVHLGEIVAAREAAGRFFEAHPQSPYGRLVFKLTGMRPLPPLGR